MTKFLNSALLFLAVLFGAHQPMQAAGGAALGVIQSPVAANAQKLLFFASRGDAGEDATKYRSIKFANPQSNGLPIWGPSNAGITVITERLFLNQPGYYGSDVWWSNDGAFGYQGGDPVTGGGTSDWYWGMCPFPQPGTDVNSTTHVHEVSGMAVGTDNVNNLNGATISVAYGAKQLRGMRISRNASTHYKTALLYVNLPSTSNDSIIQGPGVGSEFISFDFGETNVAPPNPALIIGDSRWTDITYPIERGSGYWGRIKIFAKILTQADMLSEAADMSKLVTTDGIANIWWGKTNWRTVDDLTDDYGSGRSFAWHDATYKASLVAAASVAGWN